MLKIAIIGVGTVGQSVANILEQNRDIIKARAGKEICVVKGVVRNLNKKRDVSIELCDSVDEVLEDESIDVVVELMGGVDEAYTVVKKALQSGKSVVTANKALLAYHRYELQDLVQETNYFEYEASVAGGIPIINALRSGLSANHIESIIGILNGTCNFMLTSMIKDGVEYETILKQAQELGYAEADPSFDVGGYDAAHKLLILASIAYGLDAKPEDILIEGIENITQEDINFAKEFDYSLKLLAIAKKKEDKIELRVHPTLIENSQMIAKVDGVMNGVSVIGDKVGETMYYGPGAGGDATASAVISDIITIARSDNSKMPMLGFSKPLEEGFKLASKKEILSKYYIRISVEDKAGVLAQITSILGTHNISIESMLQKSLKDRATLLLSTHECIEAEIILALEKIEALSSVKSKPTMIRIL